MIDLWLVIVISHRYIMVCQITHKMVICWGIVNLDQSRSLTKPSCTGSCYKGYDFFSSKVQLSVMYRIISDHRSNVRVVTFEAKWSKLRWWVMQTVRGWNLFSCLGLNSRRLNINSIEDVGCVCTSNCGITHVQTKHWTSSDAEHFSRASKSKEYFDPIVSNVANSYRLQEECDVWLGDIKLLRGDASSNVHPCRKPRMNKRVLV